MTKRIISNNFQIISNNLSWFTDAQGSMLFIMVQNHNFQVLKCLFRVCSIDFTLKLILHCDSLSKHEWTKITKTQLVTFPPLFISWKALHIQIRFPDFSSSKPFPFPYGKGSVKSWKEAAEFFSATGPVEAFLAILVKKTV